MRLVYIPIIALRNPNKTVNFMMARVIRLASHCQSRLIRLDMDNNYMSPSILSKHI